MSDFLKLDTALETIKRLEARVLKECESVQALIKTNDALKKELEQVKAYNRDLISENAILNNKGIDYMNKHLQVAAKYETALKDYERLAKDYTHIISTLKALVDLEP